MTIAGISSSISIIEAFASAIIDKFDLPRRSIITTICTIGFLGSLLFSTHAGLFWLDIVDHFLNHFGLVTVGILEALVIGWLYKTHRLKNHIVENLGLSGSRHRIFKYIILQIWMYCIRFITPLALGLALVYSLIEEFKNPYGGYPISGIVILGVGWLLITHVFAFGISGLPGKMTLSGFRDSIRKTFSLQYLHIGHFGFAGRIEIIQHRGHPVSLALIKGTGAGVLDTLGGFRIQVGAAGFSHFSFSFSQQHFSQPPALDIRMHGDPV